MVGLMGGIIVDKRGKWCSCFRVMNVQGRKGLGISQRDNMNGMYAEGYIQ